jgi:hypothetical protein
MTIASPPPPPAPPMVAAPQAAGQQAIAALVLGILSLVCCNLMGPVAWIIGHNEGKAIREGRSSPAGEQYAKIGMILGIVGTVILSLCVIWMFFGGIAVISSILSEASSHH